MKILEIIPKREKNNDKRPNILRIDCRKCERNPNYGNAVCIRCMSTHLIDGYRPEKIILDSGIEHDFTGEAVRLICDLSECVPHEFPSLKEKRCGTCNHSPLKIDDEMWNLFSIDSIDLLISKLDGALTDNPTCERCVVDSRKRLQETRNKLYEVSKDALTTAYRIIGV